MIKEFTLLLCSLTGGLAIWLCGAGSVQAQSLPNLSLSLNPNGKVHITWAVPMVGCVLQESSSLADPGACQTSSLNSTTDENVILVTPGNAIRVIGQTGIVLYAHTPDWTGASHELWSRPFTFSKNP